MKRKAVLALCLACFVVVSACNDQPTQANSSDLFIGSWVLKANENNVTVMERSMGLDSSKYGFQFFAKGDFVERKNAGWCGTPPITYGNFSGEWKAITDSLLDINVAYWGGRLNYRLQVITVSTTEMRIKYHYPC